ncbi:hypothetical protein Tco_1565701 [Tanacetum coccineum]
MATCSHLSGATWRRHCSITVGQPPLDHRSTVVNCGSQRWSPMVNDGQHRRTTGQWRRSTTVNGGGPPIDHRSTATVNDGQRRRTTVDHRRTTGQPAGHGRVMGRVWIWSGPCRVRVGSGSSQVGSGHGPSQVRHVDADVEMEAFAWFEHRTFEGETMHTQPYRCASA